MRLESLVNFADMFLKKKEGINEIFRKGNLQKTIGTDKFWNYDQLSFTTILDPGNQTGFLYEHFRIISDKPVDELVVIINYLEDDKEKEVKVSIPVILYENKNKYIFPVKGPWLAIGNWDDPIRGHRLVWSQEFAIDLIQLDRELQADESLKRPNTDYACYGKDVIAIADGEVIECFNQIPENPTSGTDLTNEQLHKFVTEYEQLGFVAVGAGNYVIVKHLYGEYSFYAHLITGSLTVKKGDKVKQGQVLGKVGNAGYSTAPHLHFQLMDKGSHLTGKGLPCHFINIKNWLGEIITLIDQYSTIVHTVNNNVE
jgi:hypothetical protein